jgi:succinate-acetate transporter protein
MRISDKLANPAPLGLLGFGMTTVLLNLHNFTLLYPAVTVAGDEAMAAYFFMWCMFMLLMFFGTLKTNRALQFVFSSLTVLFFLLTAVRLTAMQTYC